MQDKIKDWYKDAIIYQAHVRAFYDSNNDGIGDFKGMIHKLDYLKSLGINALWILPFYPSPLKDGGYDISDFTGIHENYGTLADFKKFIKEAHKRDIRIITELVLNHTSNEHKWFKRARKSKEGSNYRDFYVWNNTPDKYREARIIFQDFETSNWSYDPIANAYYWHRFYSHQPDLNFENPNVHKEVLKVLDFWFGIGVDGLRLDAVPYLYEQEGTNCENLPETHNFLKKLRKHIDDKYDDKMLLAEANQWPEDSSAYFGEGDECHMAFHFPLMPRLYMSVKMEDRFPVIDILDQTPQIPENCQWAIFLRNHDELTLEMVTDEERDYMYKSFAKDPKQRINLGIRRRLAPLLDNDRRKIELMNFLLFSLPGTPIVYYGDEIGMGDNFYLGDRDGVRTPMQWSSDKNAGFSKTDPQRLFLPVVIDHEYHYEAINVETQEKNTSSLLWWMRRMINHRKNYKAFSRGSLKFIHTNNPKILAFTREYENEKILILVNLSRYSQAVEIDLDEYEGYTPVEVFSGNHFHKIEDSPYVFQMQFKDYFWFELQQPQVEEIYDVKHLDYTLKMGIAEWNNMGVQVQNKMKGIILNYVKQSRWFRGKARKIQSSKIIDVIPIARKSTRSHLMFVEINYIENKSELYVLPLSIAIRDEAHELKENYPQAIISGVDIEGVQGIIYDAAYDKAIHNILFKILSQRGKLKGKRGEISGYPARKLNRTLKKSDLPLNSKIISVEQSNTSILYDNRFFFKLYRSPEEGYNPEIEMIKSLSEQTRFENLPPFSGTLEYNNPDYDKVSLGILVGFINNEGNVWEWVENFTDQFIDRVIAHKDELSDKIPSTKPSLLNGYTESEKNTLSDLIDHFLLDMIGLLGQRTAEMHLALASVEEDEAFKPDPFSLLYQKSLYQSFRTLIKRTFSSMQVSKKKFPDSLRQKIDHVLDNESRILDHIKDALVYEKIRSLKTRTHGDYHLGQVLFTGKDFIIIDFEGEPTRSLSARKLKNCPFKDVAGMLRSFHYAIYMAYFDHIADLPEDKEWLDKWLEHWYFMVANKFLNAYLQTAGDAPFIPETKEQIISLLNLFIIEKATYEADYEMNNRPDWVIIPLSGLEKILETFEVKVENV